MLAQTALGIADTFIHTFYRHTPTKASINIEFNLYYCNAKPGAANCTVLQGVGGGHYHLRNQGLRTLIVRAANPANRYF